MKHIPHCPYSHSSVLVSIMNAYITMLPTNCENNLPCISLPLLVVVPVYSKVVSTNVADVTVVRQTMVNAAPRKEVGSKPPQH
jgi:hypothetical protein